MKLLPKLIASAVTLALVLSLASCMDLGVGENEDDFKKYFSGVYVLSENGTEKYAIEKFNRDINIEDMDIPVVIDYGEYCYIGFCVSDGYTVSLSEFAFFARTASGQGVLELEFYIVDEMPTSIKNSDGEDVELPPLDQTSTVSESDVAESEGESESDSETETEIYEDDIFKPSERFHVTTFSISEEWDSVLLQFDGAKVAKSGQYIVVRINNNCYSSDDEGEDEKIPPVSFTFNYLLFYFTDAHKN